MIKTPLNVIAMHRGRDSSLRLDVSLVLGANKAVVVARLSRASRQQKAALEEEF
jgi:hypothetical protein